MKNIIEINRLFAELFEEGRLYKIVKQTFWFVSLAQNNEKEKFLLISIR